MIYFQIFTTFRYKSLKNSEMEIWASLPDFTLAYSFCTTGLMASWNGVIQSNAPRWAVVEQLAYIQSIPFLANRGIRDWVSSSTVSLKASDSYRMYGI